MSNTFTLSADGQTSSVRFPSHTLIQIEGAGTFGGGTLTPQKKAANGDWITLGSSTLTAAGAINVEIPRGTEVRVSLAGATGPDIDVQFIKIR